MKQVLIDLYVNHIFTRLVSQMAEHTKMCDCIFQT